MLNSLTRMGLSVQYPLLRRAYCIMKGGEAMKKIGKLVKRFIKDESGVGTVEIILILVVLIALVLIFKDQMTALVNSIFSKIKSESGKV